MFNGGRSDKACTDPLFSKCGQSRAARISNIKSPSKVNSMDAGLFVTEASMAGGGKMNY